MKSKNFKLLVNIFLITGSLYFIFIGLTSGKGFLVPIVTAIILAMVMAPVVAKFQSWGVSKGWAVFFADLIVVAFIAFMVFLLAAQANQVANNWSQIEKRLIPKIEQAQTFFNNTLHVNAEPGNEQQQGPEGQQQNQQQQPSQQKGQQQDGNNSQSMQQQSGREKSQQSSSSAGGFSPSSLTSGNIKSKLASIVKSVFSFLSNMLLVLIYIFFFLYYSKKFSDTITGLVKEEEREKTKNILSKISKTAQKYLFGRFILILILALLYLIGWSILGLKYALFISIIAALFSLVPYVGNLIGLLLAIAMSFLSGGGGAGQIIAIFAVFGVVQFIESYLLEPFIVGQEVDVNPVMIIVGVVLGGMVWGVMGMILSIPILGIIRVVLDNIPSLRPYGYVLDERDVSSNGGKQEKVKKWLVKKAKKAGIKK